MRRLAFLRVVVRDVLTRQGFARVPEPALVMASPEQVAAYAHAGRIDGPMAAAYLYQSAQVSAVIQDCKTVLDLACGPATQLAQIAELNPGVSFVGTDLSAEMLDNARAYVAARGRVNVRFQVEDMTRLTGIADASVDGVISTVALHHLPTREHLDACFREVARVLKPGGALYLTDFGRLKSPESVRLFAYLDAGRQPPLFCLDYENSLRAAFSVDGFRDACTRFLPASAEVRSTSPIPFFVAVKTASRPPPPALATRLRALRLALPANDRKDLDDLRLLNRLGDAQVDPFA